MPAVEVTGKVHSGVNLTMEIRSKAFLLGACCCCSAAQSCPSLQPRGLQHARPPCPSPSPGVCLSLFIASVMPCSHLILWCPLLLLPSIFPSIRDFSNELSVHIRWPKYWSFSFSVSPSSGYSRLISLKIGWLISLLSKSLLQYRVSKASILWCSDFFTVQLPQYMTTGKTIALSVWIFVRRVMSAFEHTV